MPVFDQGYRPYDGRLVHRIHRWWPITRRCLGTVRKRPLAVALCVAAGPLVFQLVRVYGSMLAAEKTHFKNPWGLGDGLFFQLISKEIFSTVLVLLVVGSGQIAEDIRTGALQIYFAKPITHADYVLGKMGTVLAAAGLTTLVPGLILLIECMLFAPDWRFLTENPWLPLKIIAFSLLVSLVLGALVLAVSSLGRRGRMVAVTFAGCYVFTMVLGKALPRMLHDWRWEAVHIGNCLDAAGRTMFNAGAVPRAPAGIAWAVLGGLFLVCVIVLARRVKAVEVVR